MNKIQTNSKLNIEYYFGPEQRQGMRGCGLWIINPPYLLKQDMEIALRH